MATLTRIADRASALRPGLMVLLLQAALALACASSPQARSMQAPGGEEPAKKASGGPVAADDKTKKAESGNAGASGSAATASGEKDGSAATPGGAQTPDEQREGLDRRLEKSLSAFDEMLLKEQQAAAAKRAEEAQSGGGSGGGGEGAGAGEGQSGGQGQGQQGQGEKGGDGRSGGKGQRTASGTRGEPGAGTDRATGSSRSGSGTAGGRVATSAPEGMPPSNDAGVRPPPDVGDGRDDDVVARQIREAALNEKDPAIREKLWEEYRRYKGIPSGTK